MGLKVYDPSAVKIFYNGLPVTGISTSQFISVERSTDSFRKIVSVNGQVTRASTLDTSGTIEITLLQSSPFNDVFTAFLSADTLSGKGLIATAILIKDFNGSTIISAPKIWISKYPELNFGPLIGDVTWTIETDNLVIAAGGSTSVGGGL